LLRTGNIETLQTLHGIRRAILTIIVSPCSHTILITDCVLCKIAFLQQ
jgi:hypothetical protein